MNEQKGIRARASRVATLGIGLGLALTGLATPILASDPPVQQIWEDARFNEAYLDFDMALANNGTMIFSDTGQVDLHTRLYSAHEASTNAPIWQETRPTNLSYYRTVASAALADVHAVVRHQGNVQAERRTVVEIYRSGSSAPVTSYQFPTVDIGFGQNWCHVTPDGSSVIACFTKSSTTNVVRFDSNGTSSGGFTIAGSWTVSSFGSPESYGISKDLTRLYLGTTSESRVFDLNTGGQLYQRFIVGGSMGDGHAFSSNGRMIAVPTQDRVDVYEWQNNTYVLSLSLPSPSNLTSQVALQTTFSANDAVLCATFFRSPNQDQGTVMAWSVPDGTQMLVDSMTASGSQWNMPTDVDCSENGSRIAVSMGGPEGTQVPGIRVYERIPGTFSYTTLESFPKDGGVGSIDLSPDGYRLGIARRRGYFGTGFGEKIIEAINLGKDVGVTPNWSQQTATVRYYPPAGGTGGSSPLCILISSDAILDNPTLLPFGKLYLTGAITRTLVTASNGVATKTLPMVGSVGSTRYYQGVRLSSPRKLSETWAALTILP